MEAMDTGGSPHPWQAPEHEGRRDPAMPGRTGAEAGPTGTGRVGPSSSLQYWTVGPGRGELRPAPVPEPQAGEVLVETLVSGISRGTETLVHRGEVPVEVAGLMRAPHQLGDLPHPVSHGYLNVGVVRGGSGDEAEALTGRTVFSLAGHRTHVTVPASDCHPLPEGCPPERALLAGAAETALNALWESGLTLGDRVTVVGGGMIGLATALLADRVPHERLELVEPHPERRRRAQALGLHAVPPGQAIPGSDVVLHASATEAGLAEALRVAGDDAVVVEQSWYGQCRPAVPLGGDFHARRLRILATQVGEVAAPRRLRRSRRDRLRLALSLLDERFDALITGRSPLQELPAVMDGLASDDHRWSETVCHVVDHRIRPAGADDASDHEPVDAPVDGPPEAPDHAPRHQQEHP